MVYREDDKGQCGAEGGGEGKVWHAWWEMEMRHPNPPPHRHRKSHDALSAPCLSDIHTIVLSWKWMHNNHIQSME